MHSQHLEFVRVELETNVELNLMMHTVRSRLIQIGQMQI